VAASNLESAVDPKSATHNASPAAIEPNSDVDDPSTQVAIRFDKTRVVFLVSDERSEFNLDEARTKKLHSLGEPVAEYGGGPLFEPDDELLQDQHELFDRAHAGEEWQLEISADSKMPVEIKQPVVLEEGCAARVGFLAEVSPPNQAEFAASKVQYFLIHKTLIGAPAARDQKPVLIGRLTDWKPTPELRTQIEQLLQARLKDEAPKVHAQAVSEYDRTVNGDPAWKPWAEQWKAFDEKLARGEGKLDYDLQAFQLAPDGVPRLFVRAKWMLDQKPAFLMRAWLRAEPTLVVESLDSRESQTMRLTIFSDAGLDLAALGTILNVFDRKHSGHGELLIYDPGYESFDLHLFRYTGTGPVPTDISLSGGC